MTKTGAALRQVLVDIGFSNVPENLQIERLFPGRHQRSAGAWLFTAFNGNNDALKRLARTYDRCEDCGSKFNDEGDCSNPNCGVEQLIA